MPRVSQHDMCRRHSAHQLLRSCHNSSECAAGHEKKEKDLTARQAALQDAEQQLHAGKARLAALEETLKVCSNSTPIILSFIHFVPAVHLYDYCHAAAVAIMFEHALDSSFLLLGCHQLA